MLKFKLFVIVGILSSVSANAGVGTRGGGLRELLHYGETVNCVGIENVLGAAIIKIVSCNADECDAEQLCAEEGLILE